MFIYIALTLIVLIAALFALAALQPSEFRVARNTPILAPPANPFEQITA